MKVKKGNVGMTTIWGEDDGGESELHRECQQQGGFEFANFNIASRESIENACKYVGSPNQEITGVLKRYGFK